MRNKVNTWPGWNGSTRYPRLRSAAGWWPVTVVYRGCSPWVKRGSARFVRGEAPTVQGCINTLSIWNTNRWPGRERDGASRYTPCGSVLRSLRSPRKPNAPSKPLATWYDAGKTWKVAALPRSDVKRQGNLRFTSNCCCNWLVATAIPNSVGYYSTE